MYGFCYLSGVTGSLYLHLIRVYNALKKRWRGGSRYLMRYLRLCLRYSLHHIQGYLNLLP